MNIKAKSYKLKASRGFTLMEIVVATTIFAFVVVALTTLFNYTLRMNRRSEAIRQASQGMRDFIETIVKEVRNGQVDFGVVNGQTVVSSGLTQCDIRPFGSTYNAATNGKYSYRAIDNRLGIIDVDGNRKCFYLGDAAGNWVGSATNNGKTLVMEKTGGVHQVVNPPNYEVQYLSFFVRPTCDPYTVTCEDYSTKAPKYQPVVAIAAKFVARLPTGEQVSIYYQTSVSSDKYDIPNAP